jgi:hypothetical protein
MRSDEEIRERIDVLLKEELDRRVEASTRRLPHRCVHNHRQPLDPRRQVGGESNPGFNRLDRRHLPVVQDVGLCMYGSDDPEEWSGDICDEPLDAQRCPVFETTETPLLAAQIFVAQVQEPGWLEAEMPNVAHLVWALGDGAALPEARIPWWRRWWLRFFPPPLEPKLPPFDPSKLLPEVPRGGQAP